jgi:uncharacterized protein DUF3455
MLTTSTATRAYSLVTFAATVLLAACSDNTPLGPRRDPSRSDQPAAFAVEPDLGACDRLKPPTGSKLAFHVYARGVQIYRWSGSAWTLYGPDATLSSDAGGNSIVGTHYVGPTWETNSGGKVVGSVIDRCTADPNAVQWLSLAAVSEGPGVLSRVTFIQRVNTVGGKAPSTAGAVVGEETRIPYSAEYFFYRA